MTYNVASFTKVYLYDLISTFSVYKQVNSMLNYEKFFSKNNSCVIKFNKILWFLKNKLLLSLHNDSLLLGSSHKTPFCLDTISENKVGIFLDRMSTSFSLKKSSNYGYVIFHCNWLEIRFMCIIKWPRFWLSKYNTEYLLIT